MLFNSLDYLIFFPIVLIVYFVIPNRIKYLWLLLASYFFYMCWNPLYILLILFSTVVTYLSGLLIENIKHSSKDETTKRNLKKAAVAISLVLNLSILFYFKYFGYGIELFNIISYKTNLQFYIPEVDILLPVGISFYTFQALGYTIDVYRDEIYAEKNFFKYALFVSFFPQLVAGPIERSKNLLKQLSTPQNFDEDRFREGLLLILWGLFLKIVIADRIAIFVDNVYADPYTFKGTYIIVATVLFAFQIYCDFAGYSTIAMGSAKILGIQLMENFDAPYLSYSVAEFWRKWHISLTSWFKDYLYIPLGGNRKGKIRKYINIMIVFLLSGLWHGANLSFVFWGGLNGLYQIIGDLISPIRKKFEKKMHIKPESIIYRIVRTIGTFILVDISWIFFRAHGIMAALRMIKKVVTTWNPQVLIDGSLYECGLDEKNFVLLFLCIIILILADCFKHKKIFIRDQIIKQNSWVRYIVSISIVIFLIVFGKYGPTYEAANFIYFQF